MKDPIVKEFDGKLWISAAHHVHAVENAMALGAAGEREACAKECEHTALRMGSEWMANHCAASIRARSDALTKLNKTAEDNGEEL